MGIFIQFGLRCKDPQLEYCKHFTGLIWIIFMKNHPCGFKWSLLPEYVPKVPRLSESLAEDENMAFLENAKFYGPFDKILLKDILGHGNWYCSNCLDTPYL